MKIIEVSSQGLSASAEHFIEFAKTKSLPWEIDLLPAFDQSLFEGCAAMMIDFSVSEQVLSGVSTLPTLVRMTNCFDSFIREGDQWHPRLLLFEALRDVVVQKAKDLDNRSSGYIVGDNTECRVAAAVMADLGITNIFVASDQSESLAQVIKHLKRNFIGVNFVGVETSSVIDQKIQCGFLINCLDLSDREDLKGDLSYFNFMKSSGLVLDLFQANDVILLEEAEQASLRFIPTSDIYLQRDLLFLQRNSLIAGFSESEFSDSWCNFLKTHPLSSYKKRHC